MERAQVSLLALARYDKRWSQERLAELMRVSSITVSRWEQGQSVPHPRHLVQLCKLFDKTPQELGFHAAFETRHHASEELLPMTDEDDAKNRLSYAAWRLQALYARLMNIIWNWPRTTTARYHELQALISLECEDENVMDRRNALFLLVSLTVEACTSPSLRSLFQSHPEEVLTHSAAGIAACRQLRKGKDFISVFDAVSKYISALKQVARDSREQHRNAAAELLAQCYILKSSLAKHITTNQEAIRYAKLAEQYAKDAQNPVLHITAVRRLAEAQAYANLWEEALVSGQKAQELLEKAKGPTPPLLHSYIHAGVATYSAYNGEKQVALSALGEAHETFFLQSDEEEIPLWIEHSKVSLLLNDAYTHMYLGSSEKAFDSFQQLLGVADSESNRVQAMIQQVMVEVTRVDQPRNMEFAIDRWTQAMERAIALRSEQWFNDGVRAYMVMCAAWPGEQRIKRLRQLMKHW